MPITVHCPNCKKKLKAKDQLAGKRVKCPGCHQPFSIPGHGHAPVRPASPPSRQAARSARPPTSQGTAQSVPEWVKDLIAVEEMLLRQKATAQPVPESVKDSLQPLEAWQGRELRAPASTAGHQGSPVSAWSFQRPPHWIEPDSPLGDFLLDASRPDVYRINAFRVTELGVEATEQEANRQIEKLRMLASYGGQGRARKGALPLSPPPDEGALREARQRLGDAQRRLLDELFWFWPCSNEQEGADPALAHLARFEVAGAMRSWSEAERQGRYTTLATHNLAVLSHLVALEWEHAAFLNGHIIAQDDAGHCDYAWQQAFCHWRKILDNNTFWGRLTQRVEILNDARLKPETVGHLRKELPLALLAINAQLALHAAEKGLSSVAKRHIGLMKAAGFEPDYPAKILRWAVEPIRERIQTLCKATPAKIEADPVHADREAEQLLNQTGPLLAVIDCLLGPDKPVRDDIHDEIYAIKDGDEPSSLATGESMRDGIHDEVALSALACQICFGNKTENWKRSIELLERTLPIAVSASARDRIKENLKIVCDNAKSNSNWCGEGYWDLPEPALKAMEAAREHAKARNWEHAIPSLEQLLSYKDLRIPKTAKRHVWKALAYCLNARGVDQLNRATEEFVRPISVIRKVAENPAILLQQTLGVRPGMPCASCGSSIWSEYTRFTFKNVPIIVCPRCAAQAKREQEEQKSKLSRSLKSIAGDLQRARELDPANNQVENNLEELHKMARQVGVTLSGSSSTAPSRRTARKAKQRQDAEQEPTVAGVLGGCLALVVMFFCCSGLVCSQKSKQSQPPQQHRYRPARKKAMQVVPQPRKNLVQTGSIKGPSGFIMASKQQGEGVKR